MGESIMLIIHPRLGIGLDIEHNETICHVVGDDDGRFVAAFNGLIVKIPFFSIYFGEFDELDKAVLAAKD